MKKYLLLALMFSFVLAWCQTRDIRKMDITSIADLPTLEGVIVQVSQEMNDWTLSMEQAQNLVNQLQQRYIDLTHTTQMTIESGFDIIQKTFDQKSFTLFWLPLWAKKLWMTEPKNMALDKTLSSYNITNDSGYNSTILVYAWDYTVALEQAKIIAQQAHLYVSKNFQQAQSLAKLGNIDYISGLDIGNLSKWIVYINHELLDTNFDILLAVSVDQDGTLTIEATKYKN